MPKDAKAVEDEIKALGEFDSFGTKKEIKFLPEVLRESESIHALASGFLDGNTWLLCVTSQRLLFLDKGMVLGLTQTEIPLDSITSVSHKTGIVFGSITVTSAGKDKKIDNILKAQTPRVAEIISDLLARRSAAPERTPTPGVSLAEELKRWADLKDRGVITDEEFQAQKAKLLKS